MTAGEGRDEGVAGGREPNLLEECRRLLVEHRGDRHCVSLHPRSHEGQNADLRLRFAGSDWLRSAEGQGLIEAFAEHGSIATAERRRSDLLIGFEPAALAELEGRLADGGIAADAPLRGRRFDVSLVGPNANKALHLGHLRNAAIGQALACSLESAGAEVRRRSLVADMGRRVCEAIAGYLETGGEPTPGSEDVAGDRFVELCTRRFQAGADGGPASAGPNERENESRGDAADSIMARWLEGGEEERALAERVTRWVLAGHERTLAGLGIAIDHYDLESEGIERALDLVALGLDRGLFEHDAEGCVVFRTGRSEYATMVLLNEAGAPTECARVLAVCHRMIAELDPAVTFLEVLGDEWRPAQTVVSDLLLELLPGAGDKSYEWLYYGLVTADGGKVGSSTGQVVWIDDFLEGLAGSPAVERLRDLGDGAVDGWELADVLARCSLLVQPKSQPVTLDPERILTECAGPAWTIAAAWSRANAEPPTSAGAPVARAGVMQALWLPPALAETIERRDPGILARYVLRLSEAFLSAPRPGPAARPVLGHALAALGLPVRGPSPDEGESGFDAIREPGVAISA